MRSGSPQPQRPDSSFKKVKLRFELSSAESNDVSKLTSEFRDISPSGSPQTVQYLEPQMRQLRVCLDRSVVPRSDKAGAANPYMVVKCGLFRAETEPQFNSLKPAWNEEFVVSVPQRTAGCSELPKELQYTEVELQLWNWEAVASDYMISKIVIPFEAIAGFDGSGLVREWGPGQQGAGGIGLDSR